MKNSKKIIVFIFILSFLSTAFQSILNNQVFTPKVEEIEYFENSSIQTSDIAGSDLYAEQINAFVAGNKSIIKQSLFTNDTSILSRFDTRDPAFYKCNVLFSASNGITPELFPRILNEDGYSKQYEMTFNSFSGFLYYDEEMNQEDVQMRARRALEIIKRKFEIDLIMVEESNPYFFPFVGYYPDWELYFLEVTTNLPMDGYWKALNVDRLSSEDYLKNYHLSSTFLLVNSLDFLEHDITKSIDQVNFNIESLDLAYLEDLGVDNIFEQFTNVLDDYEGLFGNISDIFTSNETSTQDDFGEFGNLFTTLNLSNESHYTSFMVQYEGISHGIIKISENEYSFNLWDALGYDGAPLKPSEKTFISLIGAFMSEIDINIYCTDIIDQTPQYFTLYNFLIEQISLLLYYAEIDFDVQILKDYSFELFWVDESGFKRNYIKPVNLNNETDIINFLHLIGFQGLSGIPTGIFNPIGNFEITYKISNSEPNLLVTKEVIGGNASNGVYNDFSFNITAKNVGNESAWGVPTPIPIELDDIFSIIVGPLGVILGLDQDLKSAIWEVARVEYVGQYTSIEDFFNFNDDPRIFYFDTTGAGLIDIYFPNLNNLTNLLPYNENMDEVIGLIESGNPQLISSLEVIGIPPDSLKDSFGNKDSIWNDDNWVLEPGELLTYTYDNFSIGGIDSFSPFYKYNFTITETFPSLPSLISGVSIEETTPQMALNTDNQDWIIESEQIYVDQHELEIQFLFQNETNIDLYNNSLDSVSFLINYTDPNNVLNFEVFNYSSEEFQELSPYLSTATNNSATFTFVKNQGTLEWLFDPYTRINHTILVKIKGISNSPFNISINDLDVEFYFRDVNEYLVLGSRVIYTSSSGLVEYVRTSNSVSLSTISMASIVAYAYLDSYNSYAGELNSYTIIIRNIGSSLAKNINISIVIPGIIYDPINFTIEQNILKYQMAELPSSVEEQLEFSFYVPNSAIINHTLINYSNNEIIQNSNSTTLETHPNDVYFSAPIDYLSRSPYVKTIEIFYNSSNLAPTIGEQLNVSIYVKNTGIEGFTVQNLTFSIRDQYGGLVPMNSSLQISQQITFNATEVITHTLKKNKWRGYYFPSINYFSASEQNTIQVASSKPIVLGIINFSIIKTVDKNQIEIGDIITVNITVINVGNICAKNITINDAISFTNVEFALISGSLIFTALNILPGESITFSYKIQAKMQTLVELKPTFISYFYLQGLKVLSNIIEVKVVIPRLITMSFVLGPTLVSLTILIVFVWKTRKYKAKKYELQRNELMLFKISRSEAVLKVENTLRDRFNLISKEDKERIIDNDRGGDQIN
ncbi:MAG: hypothetical protein KGD61_01690 [Candidatus Lokiarchaeota archaeon]|nr:hypothetical protein [Candidatus Lokiarchaeota archaeon]